MKNNQKLIVAKILLITLGMFYARAIYAQSESGIGPTIPNASAASFYYISKPGELTMQVNIWGAIQKPGRYEIPTSTDIIQLISFAGGPNTDAKMNKVRVTRALKDEGIVVRKEYYVDLDDLPNTETSKLELYPGDTIFIDHTSWSMVRDVLTVVTTAAIITSAIANVIIAKERWR